MSFGVEVGGWSASACVDKLVDKVCSYISDQYGYEANIKGKLKCLVEDLKQIKCLLHEADKRSIQNPVLQQWLWDLKDASYEAEDILDMFEYKNLEYKVEKTLNQVSSTPHRLIKHARTVAKRFTFLDDEVKELNEVVDKFGSIITYMGHLMQLISFEPTIKENVRGMMQSRETNSLCTEPQLFGRDRERSYLIEQLLEINNSNVGSRSKNVQVLSVVGIGGVGKTSLVQDVYSSQNVKGHFDLTAWVCVSDDFDVKRLAKEIIESASIPKPCDFHNLQNFDKIQEILKQGLTKRKFLIVLDDVWNEVARKWEMLQAILNFGDEGSRVVVTTRSQKIADMMGARTSIHLGGLVENDYWRFFVLCAFDDEDPNNYPRLEFFGRQIARRLGGNPLAAKTVGAVLKYDLNVTHWREVLESKRWQVDQQEGGIMSALRLSYDYLPVHLKQCFVYCSLFPQDYQFVVPKLVWLWIAQGLIQPDQEEIGVKYFGELFSRSFFQEAKEYADRYVVHDLLHDLARQLSDSEIFDVAESKPIEVPRRVRHLYVGANYLSLICTDEHLKKNLRSLVVTGCSNNPLEMLQELRGLRVLILDGFRGSSFPECFFNKMVHLRYLEIEGYKTWCSRKFPKSLGMLYHIQVLCIGGWWDDGIDEVLPEETKRLLNLRHLEADASGVSGISTLALLQELHFRVNSRKDGFEMSQLGNMSKLRELDISGLESVGSKQEAREAMLENKEHLRLLRLKWDAQENSHDGGVIKINEEVLEGLLPHLNLETLAIYGYCGRRSPHWWNKSWASCSYLQHVVLCDCLAWEVLPPLGLLPQLKFLELLHMNGVKQIGAESFDGNKKYHNVNMTVFPSLETLYIDGMGELMELRGGDAKIELFPRLSFLSISDCPKLRGPLFLPSQLKVLTAVIGGGGRRCLYSSPGKGMDFRCGDLSRLIEWVPPRNLASIEELRFLDIQMRNVPKELEEWFKHLTSLRSLYFEFCDNLEYVPYNLLKSLSSTLRRLSFVGCCRMESLPEEGLPSSLQLLEIDRCSDKLTKGCSKEDNGRDWHKIAHIPTIRINRRYVQQQQQRPTEELNSAMIS